MEILKTISYTGTIEVLSTLGKGPRRFTDIMFETKLNPGILNRVLKTLTKSGLILKRPNDEGYELTPKGMKVSIHIFQILELSGAEESDNNELVSILSHKLQATGTLAAY